MKPEYLVEMRYSYISALRQPSWTRYVVDEPQNDFERHLQELVAAGQAHLANEEYALALDTLQEARALILLTVHPTMPIDPALFDPLRVPFSAGLLDALVTKTAQILTSTPARRLALPSTIVGPTTMLSPDVVESLAPITDVGLVVTSFHAAVERDVSAALEAVDGGDWARATELYTAALGDVPDDKPAVRGSLLHDLAILNEKLGQRDTARQLGEASIEAFTNTDLADRRAQALATTSGIMRRAGDEQAADDMAVQLTQIRSTLLLHNIVEPLTEGRLTDRVRLRADGPAAPSANLMASTRISLEPDAPALIGLASLDGETETKRLVLNGASESVTIGLEAATALADTRSLYAKLAVTDDLALVTAWLTPIQFVAFLPHMCWFVLPMAIGDCHAGMGSPIAAADWYESVLPYPYLNVRMEVVKVWTRLAEVYLDEADTVYRNARDDVAAYAAAQPLYERIVMLDRTLDATSALYADAKFGDMKTRVEVFLAAPDPLAVEDNPSVLAPVLSALGRLRQISLGLNFFGFAPDYAPPFSFEYLQNTARYFAQHASQTEQTYIQYKAQAENEQFRRDQLDQQAEVARQMVVLEERGVAEAQAGLDIAAAGVAYAGVQLDGAESAQLEFNDVRWELLGLSSVEAWASASSVGDDTETTLTMNTKYYSTNGGRARNYVMQDLAHRRTLISHDMEASRLQRALDAAKAYTAVALAQQQQAQARLETAHQRVQLAQLQERQAVENRDFIDMREFGARLWFELAQQAKRRKRRYLDMATEIAFLMEHAYNAETERGLHVIRYGYQSTPSGNLMGADMLLADIDSFTLDYLTTTRTKKVPVKRTISIADAHPMLFDRLQRTGTCRFETTFADFDRAHPGLYLAKVRNVELLLLGVAGVHTIAGTLRNVGVSRFRLSSGDIVERLYPADVMVLSDYEIRQDSLAFRFNPNELRLFENQGIETLWQLDLRADANDFDLAEILDVQFVVYYDGFFDPTLETAVRAALPPGDAASRGMSLRFEAPDEMFYLRNQGIADLELPASSFPHNQQDLTIETVMVRVTGEPAVTAALHLRLETDGLSLPLVTGPDGEVVDDAGSPLAQLHGRALIGTWHIEITAADNPALAAGGTLDLSGLVDLQAFVQYSFTYR